MLAAACPQCGANTRVTIAQPGELRCRTCGYVGAPTPDVERALRAAQAVLQSLDARYRQLSATQRLALRRSTTGLGCAGGIVVFVGGGFISLALLGGLALFLGLKLDTILWLVAPAAFFFAGSLPALAGMFRARQRLNRTAVALPPLGAGEPACCRVCGAPLNIPDRSTGLARCGFCRADNVVDRDAMARAQESKQGALVSFEAQLRREASAIRRSTTWTLPLLLSLGPLSAIGGCVSSQLWMKHKRSTEIAPPVGEVALVDVGAPGTCVGHYSRDSRGVTSIEFEPPYPGGVQNIGDMMPGGKDYGIDPRELAGYDAVFRSRDRGDRRAKIKRVVATLAEPKATYAVVDLDGKETRIDLTLACLPDRPTDLPVMVTLLSGTGK
ncbi:MAG: hypothetical protein U0271_23695 [Polyangiaceae bacterium]